MKRLLMIILGSGIGIILLICIVFYLSVIRIPTSNGQVVDFAKRIGYSEDQLLLAYASCSEVFNGQCEDRVIYTTPDSYDILEAKMAQLGYRNMHGAVWPGSAIFTHINMSTKHRLTANGYTGKENRPFQEGFSSAEEPGTEWWAMANPYGQRIDTHGQRISVFLYKTLGTNVRYEFDGRRIEGNIVEVSYTTRP
jgi:hypothetical protein